MHYLPTDSNFDNISAVIEWAREHDAEVQQIVLNANELIDQVLSAEGIYHYWSRMLKGFHAITHTAPTLHKNALEFVCRLGQCAWKAVDSDVRYSVWPRMPLLGD